VNHLLSGYNQSGHWVVSQARLHPQKFGRPPGRDPNSCLPIVFLGRTFLYLLFDFPYKCANSAHMATDDIFDSWVRFAFHCRHPGGSSHGLGTQAFNFSGLLWLSGGGGGLALCGRELWGGVDGHPVASRGGSTISQNTTGTHEFGEGFRITGRYEDVKGGDETRWNIGDVWVNPVT